MTFRFKKRTLIIIAALFLLGGSFIYIYEEAQSVPQKWVKAHLLADPLSVNSVWDEQFFNHNQAIKTKVHQFEKGELCKSLKDLDTSRLTHREISDQLRVLGYACILRPLSVNPKAPVLTYLKVDNTITEDVKDPRLAQQEICYERVQPECVIRIKRDGFPRNRRSAPHSTKAVMIDSQGDPGSYDNEAFKVGAGGQPLPKGPSKKFGLRKCPYQNKKILCEKWVDAVMDEAHPLLKEPVKMIPGE